MIIRRRATAASPKNCTNSWFARCTPPHLRRNCRSVNVANLRSTVLIHEAWYTRLGRREVHVAAGCCTNQRRIVGTLFGHSYLEPGARLRCSALLHPPFLVTCGTQSSDAADNIRRSPFPVATFRAATTMLCRGADNRASGIRPGPAASATTAAPGPELGFALFRPLTNQRIQVQGDNIADPFQEQQVA